MGGPCGAQLVRGIDAVYYTSQGTVPNAADQNPPDPSFRTSREAQNAIGFMCPSFLMKAFWFRFRFSDPPSLISEL